MCAMCIWGRMEMKAFSCFGFWLSICGIISTNFTSHVIDSRKLLCRVIGFPRKDPFGRDVSAIFSINSFQMGPP